ncbi:hypothetical protein GQ53DRAFT_243765 [Thozetella sp. PMI_491]|nr:hypothetical protein GQ53DRAFT_243765 [Thozetella sp. PMI_491]
MASVSLIRVRSRLGWINGERALVPPILPKPEIAITDRLERIETALSALTTTVSRLIDPHGSWPGHSSTSTTHASRLPSHDGPVPGRTSRQDPPHIFSSLEEVGVDLNSFQSPEGREPEHRDAVLGLQNLASTLESFRLESRPTNPLHGTSYIAPDVAGAEFMISRFHILARRVDIFWQMPSDELLHRAIRDPSQTPRIWVVFINYMLLASPSSCAQAPQLAQAWRVNARVALEHAGLFLEPSKVAVQTFMLLAVHSDDFVSPNISWMLMSHACRQAQALSLQVRSTCLDPDEWQRQLSLFWCLFVVDKWFALAFGRPAFLPGVLYKNVPSPSLEHLTKFKPHFDNLETTPWDKNRTTFGAHVFFQCIELAKLTDVILERLSAEDALCDRSELKASLDNWHRTSIETLSRVKEAEMAALEPEQLEKMTSGIQTMHFRYLHILLLLTKDVPEDVELRVTSARQALAILPQMASHWNNAYGVIWQLLYFPFTPFFVLFGHIVRNPHGASVPEDLRLLLMLGTYLADIGSRFNLMRSLIKKLQHTSEVFYRLALRHTRPDLGSVPLGHVHMPLRGDECDPAATGTDSRDEGRNLGNASTVAYPDLLPDVLSMEYGDVERFLSWLPDDACASMGRDGMLAAARPSEVQSLGEGEAPRGQKRPFDATFDWFSWETYYSKTDSPGPAP